MPRNIVFIVGANYCGSTLLGLILGSHSKCEFVGEINKIQNYEVAPQSYLDAKKAGFCFFCSPGKCPVMSKVATYEDVFAAYPKKMLIDTSKKAKWIRKHSKHNIKVIFITRDVESVYASFQKRGRKTSKKQIAEKIKSKYREVKMFNPLKISYNEMCGVDGIQKCCKFLGITYELKMMDFWKKKHHGIGNEQLIAGVKNGTIREIYSCHIPK